MTANMVLLVAAVFALLLGLEWRYRLRRLRLAAAVLAMLLIFFSRADLIMAIRYLHGHPEERVTHLRGQRVSDYYSGVLSMYEAGGNQANEGANSRLLGLGVLFWLACSPVLRATGAPARPGADESDGAGRSV